MAERDELDEAIEELMSAEHAARCRSIRDRERKLALLAAEVHDSFKHGWIFKAHDWMMRYEEACK